MLPVWLVPLLLGLVLLVTLWIALRRGDDSNARTLRDDESKSRARATLAPQRAGTQAEFPA